MAQHAPRIERLLRCACCDTPQWVKVEVIGGEEFSGGCRKCGPTTWRPINPKHSLYIRVWRWLTEGITWKSPTPFHEGCENCRATSRVWECYCPCHLEAP